MGYNVTVKEFNIIFNLKVWVSYLTYMLYYIIYISMLKHIVKRNIYPWRAEPPS